MTRHIGYVHGSKLELFAPPASAEADPNWRSTPTTTGRDTAKPYHAKGSVHEQPGRQQRDLRARGRRRDQPHQQRRIRSLPVFSPDGSKIAFDSSRDGHFELYVMDADGTDQTNISNNAVPDHFPDWSPDGEKFAFTSGRDGGHFEIYAMNANGKKQKNLTTNSVTDLVPDWQPLVN